jgi:hypothetical protein
LVLGFFRVLLIFGQFAVVQARLVRLHPSIARRVGCGLRALVLECLKFCPEVVYLLPVLGLPGLVLGFQVVQAGLVPGFGGLQPLIDLCLHLVSEAGELLFQAGLRRGVRNGVVLVWLCCLPGEGITMLAAGGRFVTCCLVGWGGMAGRDSLLGAGGRWRIVAGLVGLRCVMWPFSAASSSDAGRVCRCSGRRRIGGHGVAVVFGYGCPMRQALGLVPCGVEVSRRLACGLKLPGVGGTAWLTGAWFPVRVAVVSSADEAWGIFSGGRAIPHEVGVLAAGHALGLFGRVGLARLVVGIAGLAGCQVVIIARVVVVCPGRQALVHAAGVLLAGHALGLSCGITPGVVTVAGYPVVLVAGVVVGDWPLPHVVGVFRSAHGLSRRRVGKPGSG